MRSLTLSHPSLLPHSVTPTAHHLTSRRDCNATTDTDHEATVKMPASEFQRIVRDMSTIGEAVNITVTKEGVKFSTTGELGSGNVHLKQVCLRAREWVVCVCVCVLRVWGMSL